MIKVNERSAYTVNRDNHTDVILGALVEFLCERHNIYTVLTQRRANRRSRCCFTCGNLKLNKTCYLLCHTAHLHIVVNGETL